MKPKSADSVSVLAGPSFMSEALPITYDQYVVVELADKLYNSVTVDFCTL